jgi:hypothetical protein
LICRRGSIRLDWRRARGLLLLRANGHNSKILEAVLAARRCVCSLAFTVAICIPALDRKPAERCHERCPRDGVQPRSIQHERQDGDEDDKSDE